jgi:two-component system response regulator HydG
VAALPAELLESELFGHARGAFTGANRAKPGLFEAANGGSLFLDEIGDMPTALQVKLLRALQDGEIRRVGDTKPFAVDVRVICATHRDLTDLVEGGRFRQDLLYRLKVLTLQVPPLRQRGPDIMPLARQFLRAERTVARDFSEEAEHCLLSYPWPGNVRELENAVKHGAALATGPEIEAGHLPEEIRQPRPRSRPGPGSSPRLRSLAEVEREHILAVLAACDGAVGPAARILGIGRTTLWRKLKRYE